MSEYSKQRHQEIAILGNLINPRFFVTLMDSLTTAGITEASFRHQDTREAWSAVNRLFISNGETWRKNRMSDDIEIRASIFEHLDKSEVVTYVPQKFTFESARNMARLIVSKADLYSFKKTVRTIESRVNTCSDSDTAVLLTRRLIDEWERSGARKTESADIEAVATELKSSQTEAMKCRRNSSPIINKGLTVPWSCLDTCYDGLAVGLHIIAARPSEGKTTLAINLSRHWRNMNIKHAFISLDMPINETVKRYGCLDIKQPYSRMSNGYSNPTEIDRFNKAVNSYKESMFLYDCPELTAVEMAIRESYHNGAQTIIVDYLQLIYSETARNEYDCIRESVKLLKRVAQNLKIPIILLAQLNRQGVRDGREPELHDIQGGGIIEQAASSVLTIGRDKQVCAEWNLNPPLKLAGGNKLLAPWLRPVWITILKNQTGPIGKYPFVMACPHYGLFEGNVNGTPLKDNNEHMFYDESHIDGF